MVRLLASVIICVSVSAAAAHDADCNSGAGLTNLNFMQEKMFRFLKKLSLEVDQQFPADKYIRLGVDRATGPLVASLQQDGLQASSLPIRANFEGQMKAGSRALERFNTAMDLYFPKATATDGKTVLLMIYDEDPARVVSFVKQVREYLSAQNRTVALKVELFVPQMKLKWIREATEVLLGADAVNVRSIANTNEVRHWMMELLSGQIPSVHEFTMIDAFGDKPVAADSSPRPAFTALKADLAKLR